MEQPRDSGGSVDQVKINYLSSFISFKFKRQIYFNK